jgi:predicted regulator of Ras-like GTPase activity (Roadblock/LC7/MglB family)
MEGTGVSIVTGGVRRGADTNGTIDAVTERTVAAELGLARAVIGYNHDLPHGGHIYHVQTEDSGRAKGHIFTHVFRSGIIVATNKVDYDRMESIVRIVELARDSHKLMMRRLVRGDLDGEIARAAGCSTGQGGLATAGRRHSGEEDSITTHRKRLQKLIEALDMDNMSQILENLRSNVAGTLGVALVDYESGMCLGTSGTGLNMELAAAGNMEVMKAKMRVMRDLGIRGGIEDILITLDSQYHIIRPVGSNLFLYLAMDRKQGNLALARHKLAAAAADVKV